MTADEIPLSVVVPMHSWSLQSIEVTARCNSKNDQAGTKWVNLQRRTIKFSPISFCRVRHLSRDQAASEETGPKGAGAVA